jgi:hypothetical protein
VWVRVCAVVSLVRGEVCVCRLFSRRAKVVGGGGAGRSWSVLIGAGWGVLVGLSRGGVLGRWSGFVGGCVAAVELGHGWGEELGGVVYGRAGAVVVALGHGRGCECNSVQWGLRGGLCWAWFFGGSDHDWGDDAYGVWQWVLILGFGGR